MSHKPKKIVSTREYLKAIGKRLMWSTLSLALFLAALDTRVADFAFIYMLDAYPHHPSLKIIAHSGIIVFLCNLLITLGAGWAGIRTFKRARQMDPVLPCTRANIAHLPVAESLVRASQPPVLSQQSVLLRPATDTQDKHEEQLLRPL